MRGIIGGLPTEALSWWQVWAEDANAGEDPDAPGVERDPWDAPARLPGRRHGDIRAVLTAPSAQGEMTAERIDAVLIVSAGGAVQAGWTVIDEAGQRWSVRSVLARRGLGLDHDRLGLVRVDGA